MLTFTSLGTTSFRLTGGTTPIVAFPKAAPKGGKEAITLVSIPEESANESGQEGTVSWPGEYNIGGISLKGLGQDDGKQVSYVAEVDGIRCAFLSSPLQDWTEKQFELVGEVDVLVLPAADVKLTQKLVDEFDPRVLILLPGEDKQALSAVEKIIGVKERAGEYKMKGSLPQEGRDVIVLQ